MTDFSIITATMNAEATIVDCLSSIYNQEDVSVEHLLIDGGSTDRTVEIVHEFGKASHVISEVDNGLYDAMNKGIKLASGDIIGILNGDDFYSHNQVLSTLLKTFNKQKSDSCYGDLQYVDFNEPDRVIRHWRSGTFNTPKQFYWGWMPPHPTFFVKKEVYERLGLFNLQLGSAADYEIMLRFLVKHNLSTSYIPEVLVKMRSGGVSNASISNRITANKMDRKAWKVNGLKPYPFTLMMKPARKISQWFLK
ncbi:MAG TPA: glycosyltransferase [Desulfocapsa sulfexigens]|nr:glycosyltransferase [Desulfocapsa sulfexigens]